MLLHHGGFNHFFLSANYFFYDCNDFHYSEYKNEIDYSIKIVLYLIIYQPTIPLDAAINIIIAEVSLLLLSVETSPVIQVMSNTYTSDFNSLQ